MLLLKLLAAVAAAFVVLSIFVGPRRALVLWRRFGLILGDIVARVVLTAFYFTIFVPFALITRALRDPLGLARTDGATWIPVEGADETLESARRQY